jgi:hypothetical protein
VWLEGLGKLKKFIPLTRFQTRDLPACSIVLYATGCLVTTFHIERNLTNLEFMTIRTIFLYVMDLDDRKLPHAVLAQMTLDTLRPHANIYTILKVI